MHRAFLAAALVVLAACSNSADARPDSSVVSTADAETTTGPGSAATPSSSTASDDAATSETVSTPAPPTTAESPVAGQPVGFERTAAIVTKADGTECDVCLWLAATTDQRSRGLQFVTDLGDAAGMAFRYADTRNRTFWMKNTLIPLSIAFFDPAGDYIDAFDMQPCTTSTCRNYDTPNNFLVAVEVPQGELAEHGLVPGSRLELLGTECPEP